MQLLQQCMEEAQKPNEKIMLEAQLERLLEDARQRGLSDYAALRAVCAWAAKQAFEDDGFPAARALMLDSLEGILLQEACGKSAA